MYVRGMLNKGNGK